MIVIGLEDNKPGEAFFSCTPECVSVEPDLCPALNAVDRSLAMGDYIKAPVSQSSLSFHVQSVRGLDEREQGRGSGSQS